MVWLVAIALFVAWFVGKFILGKGGFVHIILLCAVAVAVVITHVKNLIFAGAAGNSLPLLIFGGLD